MDGGLYQWWDTGVPGESGFTLIAKYPAEVGDQFIGITSNIYEVVSVDTLLTIGNKTYNCIGYQNLAANQSFMYYAPGMGIVKMENGGISTSELFEFQIE